MAEARAAEAQPLFNDDGIGMREGIKILAVGHNGSGKSSMINKFVGQDVARIGNTLNPTAHEPVKEYECTVGGVRLKIYDTRGFGDTDMKEQKILDAISDMKTVDIVLICHCLYGRVDKTTDSLLSFLLATVGNNLLQHTVFVFTKGDHYIVNKHLKRPEQTDAEAMQALQSQLETELRQILINRSGREQEIINNIPSCITSGLKTCLPTSANWVDELWEICQERCPPRAKQLVNKIKQHVKTALMVAGGVAGGVAGVGAGFAIGGAIEGAVIGATLGSVVPGPGNIAGGVVGGVAGIGVAAGIVGTAVIYKKLKK